jgi:prepilin-type N-terminal cleavage/methylation domain-containing protein
MGVLRKRRHLIIRRRGFTLLESMMALIIIALGVLAFVDAQASFTRSNTWSSQAATGMLLANEIREATRRLSRHDPVTGLSLNGGVLVGWGRENGEVTFDDIDDLDDLDGMVFGEGGTMPGPVDAFGNLVSAIDIDGTTILDANGDPVPLTGWRQSVRVEKVDPYNFSQTRPAAYAQSASAQLPHIPVDRFPLRVTVSVTYQGLGETQAIEITRLTWIVLP